MNSAIAPKKEFFMMGISKEIKDLENSPKEIGALWDRLYAENIIEKIPNKKDSNDFFGVYHDYDEDGSYTITIGCEVEKIDTIPDGMIGLEIPEQTYAMFFDAGKSPDVVIGLWDYIWSIDLPRAFSYDFERYVDVKDPSGPVTLEIYIAL